MCLFVLQTSTGKYHAWPDAATHACNPIYLGVEIGWIVVPDQPRHEAGETPSQSISQVWWCVTAIPATEAVSRRIMGLRPAPGKNLLGRHSIT
jgi:hypothetical protein